MSDATPTLEEQIAAVGHCIDTQRQLAKLTGPVRMSAELSREYLRRAECLEAAVRTLRKLVGERAP
jgi:hypothetical protein